MVELLVSRSENWWAIGFASAQSAIAYLNEQYAVGTLEIKLA